MGMAIDEAGHQHPALAIQQIVDPRGPLVARLEHLRHAAVVADQQAREAPDRAAPVERQALDIVDQGIGPSRNRSRAEQGGGQRQQGRGNPPAAALHLALPGSGRRRTSALVSCRPPPSA